MSRPIGGMRMSLTSDVMILPKDAPMMMPTAMSMTLPRIVNSLNSFSIVVSARKLTAALGCASASLLLGRRREGFGSAGVRVRQRGGAPFEFFIEPEVLLGR